MHDNKPDNDLCLDPLFVSLLAAAGGLVVRLGSKTQQARVQNSHSGGMAKLLERKTIYGKSLPSFLSQKFTQRSGGGVSVSEWSSGMTHTKERRGNTGCIITTDDGDARWSGRMSHVSLFKSLSQLPAQADQGAPNHNRKLMIVIARLMYFYDS